MDFKRVLIFRALREDFLACASVLVTAKIPIEDYILTMDPRTVEQYVVPNMEQLLVVDDFNDDQNKADEFALNMKMWNAKLIVANLAKESVTSRIYDLTLDTNGPEGFYGHFLNVVKMHIRLHGKNRPRLSA